MVFSAELGRYKDWLRQVRDPPCNTQLQTSFKQSLRQLHISTSKVCVYALVYSVSHQWEQTQMRMNRCWCNQSKWEQRCALIKFHRSTKVSLGEFSSVGKPFALWVSPSMGWEWEWEWVYTAARNRTFPKSFHTRHTYQHLVENRMFIASY